nr:signal peptidase I [Thermobrachium celere]
MLDPGSKGRGIYIKRIIGLPNEVVEIKDGSVYINGNKLKEDYLEPGTYTDVDMKITVPEDCVFVLGDNREVSEDSRYIGPIPIKNLKGHAVFRIYPFSDIKKLR